MSEKLNDVPAEGQMQSASEVYFIGDKDAPLKILVVGNSITIHGPRPEIGWNFNWGMAASAAENDYVHRLYAKLEQSGINALFRVRSATDWELNFKSPECISGYAEDRDFAADIVIFRVGENVPYENYPEFKEASHSFIRYLSGDSSKVVLTTGFWNNPERNRIIDELANETGWACADITTTDDAMLALGKFEHRGVSIHPGDAGMEMIATKIYEVIRKL